MNDTRKDLGIMAALGVAVCCGLPLLLGAATLAATGVLLGSITIVGVGGALIVPAARRFARGRRAAVHACCNADADRIPMSSSEEQR